MPPVLACFTDQDARVRYYACEAMYNIAKVAKGEILIYFNHIFDALCKVSMLHGPLDVRSLPGMMANTVLRVTSLALTRNSQSRMVPSCWTVLSRT